MIESDFVRQERAVKEASPAFRLAVYLYPKHKPWRTDPDTLRDLDKAYKNGERHVIAAIMATNNALVEDIGLQMYDDLTGQNLNNITGGKEEYVRPWWAGFPTSFSIEKGLDRQKIVENMVREG